jgi:hypothetical protein
MNQSELILQQEFRRYVCWPEESNEGTDRYRNKGKWKSIKDGRNIQGKDERNKEWKQERIKERKRERRKTKEM